MKTLNLRAAIAALILGCALIPAAAQVDAPGRLEFGVKGGLALPSFFWTGDNGWNPSTMFAFQGAAYGYACVNFSGAFALQVEAGYAGKGCSVDASDGSAHWYMDYLDLPVWAKFSMREGGLNTYGGLGGYFSYFLGGRYDFRTGEAGLDGKGGLTSGTAEGPTVVRPLDFGVLLACGFEGDRLSVEFRMPIAVVNSMEFTPPPVFGGARGSLNSGIAILVGYRL